MDGEVEDFCAYGDALICRAVRKKILEYPTMVLNGDKHSDLHPDVLCGEMND